ncbi:MAG: hypothetical protein JOS17DRAFT_792428 [Linnemannia elongata]|nr:MAG: hypothetical protein JOS17DRAFT_792428 [Linnemannia elongata]
MPFDWIVFDTLMANIMLCGRSTGSGTFIITLTWTTLFLKGFKSKTLLKPKVDGRNAENDSNVPHPRDTSSMPNILKTSLQPQPHTILIHETIYTLRFRVDYCRLILISCYADQKLPGAEKTRIYHLFVKERCQEIYKMAWKVMHILNPSKYAVLRSWTENTVAVKSNDKVEGEPVGDVALERNMQVEASQRAKTWYYFHDEIFCRVYKTTLCSLSVIECLKPSPGQLCRGLTSWIFFRLDLFAEKEPSRAHLRAIPSIIRMPIESPSLHRDVNRHWVRKAFHTSEKFTELKFIVEADIVEKL